MLDLQNSLSISMEHNIAEDKLKKIKEIFPKNVTDFCEKNDQSEVLNFINKIFEEYFEEDQLKFKRFILNTAVVEAKKFKDELLKMVKDPDQDIINKIEEQVNITIYKSILANISIYMLM